MTGARTLEQVLADWRGEAAVLRRRGHDAQAATIEQLADDVAGAAEDYLTFAEEREAQLYSGAFPATVWPTREAAMLAAERIAKLGEDAP